MAEFQRGLLDTSVIIDFPDVPVRGVVAQAAISTITLAELSAGVQRANDAIDRAKRIRRLQWAETSFDVLPFDGPGAHSYGYIYALVLKAGRKPRGRLADLLIASTALLHGIPLLTRNPKDFVGLESVLKVVPM